MQKRILKKLAFPVLAIALVAGVGAFELGMAQDNAIGKAHHGGGQGSGANHREEMMRKLGLSQEQMEKLKAIRQQAKAETDGLRQEMRQKRRAMMEYMSGPNANEAQALAMNKELSQLKSRMGEMRVKTWFKMRTVLTPEQMQKMAEQMKERREKYGRGGGGHHGGLGMGLFDDEKPGSGPSHRFQAGEGGHSGGNMGHYKKWEFADAGL